MIRSFNLDFSLSCGIVVKRDKKIKGFNAVNFLEGHRFKVFQNFFGIF